MKNIGRPFELFFRHTIVYPLLRLLFRNQQHPKPIDLKRVRKVLILRYDRIGDVIVTTPVFRALRKANPKLTIAVLCSPSNAELVRHHPCVDRVHILHSNWWRLFREIAAARRERYDVVLNFIFNRTTSAGVLANLIAPRGLKIGQGAEKYRFYFNRLLQLPRADRHMTEVLAFFVNQSFNLNMKPSDLRLDIIVDEDSKNSVSEFLRTHSLGVRPTRSRQLNRYCVLNISAADAGRKITDGQGKALARYLSADLAWNTVVISSPEENAWKKRIVSDVASARCIGFPAGERANLREVAALIRESSFVVTPDTSIVHFAAAQGIPVFGLYTRFEQIAVEWLPYKVKNKIVYAPQGLPISSIPEDQVRRELRLFVGTLRNPKDGKKR